MSIKKSKTTYNELIDFLIGIPCVLMKTINTHENH